MYECTKRTELTADSGPKYRNEVFPIEWIFCFLGRSRGNERDGNEGVAVRWDGIHLIVGLLFEPTSRVAPQVETSGLVINEDRQHERQSREPPHEPINVHNNSISSFLPREILRLILGVHAPTQHRQFVSLST